MATVASNEPTAIDAVIYKGSLWHFAYPILGPDGQLIPTAAGLTGRAQVRKRAADTLPLFTFTDVTINTTDKTVELKVPGVISAAWEWRSGVMEVEVIDASGESHTIAVGAVRTRENVAR